MVTIPKKVSCLVLIPAGPDVALDELEDTVESVFHYMDESECAVAIIDDSRVGRFAPLSQSRSNVEVIPAVDLGEGDESIPHNGSLFVKQMAALRELLPRYEIEVLLKMDVDALIISDAPHRDVLDQLNSDPQIGIVGAFTRRGDGSDKAEAMAAKGRQLDKEVDLRKELRSLRRGRISRFRLMRVLRRLVRKAEPNGYTRGDTCTGGAYFISARLLNEMRRRGYLRLNILRWSILTEDSLMGILSYACGFRLADPPRERDPLAINWRGLPMPLEELVRQSKKIVHPIKDDDPDIEPRVRAFFQRRRA